MAARSCCRPRRQLSQATGAAAAAAAAPMPAAPPAAAKLAINRGHVRFGRQLRSMRTCNHLLDDPAALRRELRERGFLYLKDMIPTHEVETARTAIGAELESAGVVASNSAAMPMAPPDPTLSGDYHTAIVKGLNLEHHPALHTLGESRSLVEFFDHLFGEPCVASSWKRIRPIAPGGYSGFHHDHIYMGQGSSQLLTAWVPLMPIDLSLGGLVVLERPPSPPQSPQPGTGAEPAAAAAAAASANDARLRETYGRYDVDDAWIRGDGTFTEDPTEALRYGQRFVTSEFEVGDLVVFDLHVLHGSATNVTGDAAGAGAAAAADAAAADAGAADAAAGGAADAGAGRLRLSIDVRYQPASDPVDERWMGAPETWGYRVATYEARDTLPNAMSMLDAKARWGLPIDDMPTNKL